MQTALQLVDTTLTTQAGQIAQLMSALKDSRADMKTLKGEMAEMRKPLVRTDSRPVNHILEMKMAQHLDSRCVLLSDPSAFDAGGKTRLESSLQTFKPHFIYGLLFPGRPKTAVTRARPQWKSLKTASS